MSLAPLVGPLREGASRYVDLPVLALCSHCRQPVEPLSLVSVANHGAFHTSLCDTCAARLAVAEEAR